MICNRTLSITVLLNSLGNFLVPLVFVVKYTLIEYFFKRWPIGVSLALGYLGNIFVSLKMFNEAANKIIFPEDGLSLYLIPDSFLINPPFDKLAVFFLGLGSRSAALPEYPVFGEAVVERFLPCRGTGSASCCGVCSAPEYRPLLIASCPGRDFRPGFRSSSGNGCP